MTALITLVFACALQFEDMGGQADIEALAGRIRETLGRVDEALIEASEVDVVTDEVARARRLHLDVIRDIEALIQQLEYQFQNPPPNGGGGGGQGGSSQQPQQQPPPRPSDGSRDQPGSAPETESGASSEEEQGEQPQGADQPDEGSSQDQRSGNTPPPPDPPRPFTREDTDGRWGLLPPKVQEQLNNLHVDDVPDRYRGWLDAYIKAMRRLE